jgi:predicted DNA-binding transcriptional regulator AlpA
MPTEPADRTQSAAPEANPLLTGKPWSVAGISRSAWYRLESADQTPAPVSLPGRDKRYRISDIVKWVGQLKPGRRRRRPSA